MVSIVFQKQMKQNINIAGNTYALTIMSKNLNMAETI